MEGDEFGQKTPPLHTIIEKILERYPDGQIFKVRYDGVLIKKIGSLYASGIFCT
jgi:hypothetical protein